MKNLAGLYVHIPFCARKCSYCSFAIAVGRTLHHGEYLAALEKESVPDGIEVTSVYIGGGTPSCLAADDIVSLLGVLRRKFKILPGAEITFEMNPESVDANKARLIKDLGVTRLSLGVQSFNDARLQYLGRPHNAEDAVRAFRVLRAADFDNINVDLIFGFPGQTQEDMVRDVDAILALGSEHIALYSLNIEPRSLFFVRGLRMDEDHQAFLYEGICRKMIMAGMAQYEVSNFSLPGREAIHNVRYWEGGDYIGLGMAAHSHWQGERFWNTDTLPAYMTAIRERGCAHVGSERLSPAEKLMEIFLCGLRMNKGVDLGALQIRFNCEMSTGQQETLEGFMEMGLIEERDNFVRATPRGRLMLDELAARLI